MSAFPSNVSFFSNEPELLYIGSMKMGSGWRNSPHSHNFCEINYIARGKACYIIDGKEYDVGPGCITVVNPHVVHEEYLDPFNDTLNVCFFSIHKLDIPGTGIGNLIAPNTCPVIYTGDQQYVFENYLFDILRESSSQSFDLHKKSREIMHTLLDLIIKFSQTGNNAKNDSLVVGECERIKDYIDTNYHQPIDLDTLASMAHVSRHYLSHAFKIHTGISPIRYLINRRINEARRLLDQTKFSISQISRMVGYDDPIYFSQMFKKVMGTSPQNYREMLK